MINKENGLTEQDYVKETGLTDSELIELKEAYVKKICIIKGMGV